MIVFPSMVGNVRSTRKILQIPFMFLFACLETSSGFTDVVPRTHIFPMKTADFLIFFLIRTDVHGNKALDATDYISQLQEKVLMARQV